MARMPNGDVMRDSAPPVCVWLKRDVRGRDHAALAEACARARGGAVFAVFVHEPEVFAQPEWDSSHTEFQRECLGDAEAALGAGSAGRFYPALAARTRRRAAGLRAHALDDVCRRAAGPGTAFAPQRFHRNEQASAPDTRPAAQATIRC